MTVHREVSFHLPGGSPPGAFVSNFPVTRCPRYRCWYGNGTISAPGEVCRARTFFVLRFAGCPDPEGWQEKEGSQGRRAARYRTLTKVTLRLFDTGSRAVREFRPVTQGKASVYLCGATVQGAPHLGHLRSATCFDILVRWLEASGYQVTYCRNVTDIDDKILGAAAAEGIPWWALAERNRREFVTAYALLGCRPPDVEPRATGHIPDMIALIERLMASGHAYPAGGDVYFEHRRRGRLRRPVQAAAGRHAGRRGRAANPRRTSGTRGTSCCGRARSRASPPGRLPGAPGARVAHRVLGHGRRLPRARVRHPRRRPGPDLPAPRERARAVARRPATSSPGTGSTMAWSPIAGMKMSKTAGNAVAAADALRRVRPQELRYYLGQAHYRSTIEYSPGALEDAAAAYQRIERFVTRAQHLAGPPPPASPRQRWPRQRCRSPSPPRWTTTSAFPPRSPRCTPQCTTATTL